ncbi:MAG: hypothetical protein HDQ88_04710 [Clostridia bacterium]|nr:hypothetical protein [Clostridia bacterium]
MPIDVSKLTDILDNPSSQSPVLDTFFKPVSTYLQEKGIDNKLLNNLQKHNNNSLAITKYNVDRYIESRARNQSTSDRIGNALAQTVGEVLGGSIEGLGSIIGLLPKLFSTNEAYTRNQLERLGNSINEGFREAFPIYMTEKAQSGNMLERMQGGGYWATMTPSVLGSALGIMLPARGASMLLGKAGRLAINGLSKSQKAAKIFKLANEMQKAKAISKFNKFNDIYASAFISRTLDSSREAYGVYEEQKQWFYDNYNKFIKSDKDGNNILNIDNKEIKIDNNNIDKIAHEYASRAAEKGYWNSMSNIIYDIVEWSGIMGASNTLSKVTRDNLRKALGKGDKYAIMRALHAIPAEAKRNLIGDAGRFGYGALAEMADEMTMSIAMSEGTHSAKKEYGFLSEQENYAGFSDRLHEYLRNPDIWTEGIGGLLGGAGMQTVMPYLERKLNKNQIKKEDAYLKALEHSVDAMRSGMDNIIDALAKGDLVEAKNAEMQSIINQVAANTLDGSLDFYIEMLKNMQESMDHILDIKRRKEANQQITAEEQMALDSAGDLVNNPNIFKSMLNKIETIKPIFERNYDSVPQYVDKDTQSILYEIARRKSVYESHKALIEAELSALEQDDIEEFYQIQDNILDDYLESKYTDENERANKKAEITRYTKNKTQLENAKLQIKYLEKQQNELDKKIKEIDDALNEVKPEEKDTIGEQLKLAKNNAEHRKKSIDTRKTEINKTIDRLNEEAKDITQLDATDKEKAELSEIFKHNKLDPDNYKTDLRFRKALLDSELDYLNSEDAYKDIQNELEAYRRTIDTEVAEDTKKELDKYNTSEELKKHQSDFESSEEAKKAYEAKLKLLETQEKAESEREARAKAVQKQDIENRTKEYLEARGYTSEQSKTDNNLEIPSIDDEDVKLLNQAYSEIQDKDISLSAYLRGKAMDATNESIRSIYSRLADYVDAINEYNENALDFSRVNDSITIAKKLLTDYTGLAFMTTAYDLKNGKTISFNPKDYSNIAEQIRAFLIYANAVLADKETRTIQHKDDNFGINDVAADTINKLRDRFLKQIEDIQKKYDKILTLLGTKGKTYIEINGTDYEVEKVLDEGMTGPMIYVKGLRAFSAFITTPYSDADATTNYILKKKAQSSAPDLTSSSTGGSKATISSTRQQISNNEVKPNETKSTVETTINTEDDLESNEAEEADVADIEFDIEDGKTAINFKLEHFNTSDATDFLLTLMENPNYDNDTANAIIALCNILVKTGFHKKDYYKKLITNYLNDNLTEKQQIIVNAAKALAKSFNVDLDSDICSLNPKGDIDYAGIYNTINQLPKLYTQDLKKYSKSIKGLIETLKTFETNDNAAKMARVILGDILMNPEATETRLDELLSQSATMLKDMMTDEFINNLSLIFNLINFINDQRGFKSTSMNMYDLITGLRMHRGDHYSDITDEILSLVTTVKYIKEQLASRVDFYNNKYKQTKDKYFKNAYLTYKTFNDILDIEGNYTDLKTEADVIRFINNNPIISFGKSHSGLDIIFDNNDTPHIIFDDFVNRPFLGIYDILHQIDVGDEIELVPTNNEENPNKVEYDIVYRDKVKNTKHVIGHMPALETIENGIAYVIKGRNNVNNVRKFKFTQDDANIFAEFQNVLFPFIYNYGIAFEDRNNVSEKEREAALKAVEVFSEQIKKSAYKDLVEAFKRVIYGNLELEQINQIIDSGLDTILVAGKSEKIGEVKSENLPLSIGQMYQLCKDMFAGVVLTKAMGRGNKSAESILHTFENSINRRASVFKHNQGIRGDIKATGNHVMTISSIGAGQVIINEDSRKEDNEISDGLPIMHHRQSLVKTLCPVNIFGKDQFKPTILQIDENGFGFDPETGFVAPLNRFATKHTGDQFIKGRNKMVCVVQQTKNVFTTFPVKPNTIMGSITDETREARIQKLLKYNKYISNAMFEIFDLLTEEINVSDGRINVTNRLQNVIICEESSSVEKNDIHFQTSNDTSGNKVFIMFKVTYGTDKERYIKMACETTESGEHIVRIYTGKDKDHVALYNGSTSNPSYTGIVTYKLGNTKDGIYTKDETGRKALTSYLYQQIPNLTRQFGMVNGMAVAKDVPNKDMDQRNNGYVDPVTGESYKNIYDYYMRTNAIYSDIGAIRDEQGMNVSNVSASGTNPVKFSITSKEFDDPNAQSNQTFYSAVDAMKEVQKGDYKEDWESINEAEAILEEEMGVKPVYIVHTMKADRITETGSAQPRKVQDGTNGLPRGFNFNSYRIDIFHSPVFASKKANKNYLTKTMLHEMLHVFMMKHYNITQSELRLKEIREQKEALIQFHNEEVTKWINDFIASIKAAKERIAKATEPLSHNDSIINAALNTGETSVIDQLITIFTNEVNEVNANIQELLEARAKGTDVIINGQQTLQEVFTYAFTEPQVYHILNALESVSERDVNADNMQTPTIWQKFLDVIRKIFARIFNIANTEVNKGSSLERLMDVINKVFTNGPSDIDIKSFTIGDSLNLADPGREENVDRSDTNSESSGDSAEEANTAEEVEPTSSETNESENEEETTNEDDDDFGDLFVDTNHGDIKASKVLTNNEQNNVKDAVNYLHKLNDMSNENIIFDEMEQRIC